MDAPADIVGFHARLQPERLAAIDLASGRRWTYSQLDEAIGRCARVLVDRGVQQGDRIVALAANRVDLVILHMACARIGAIYVPLNWRLAADEIHALIEDVEPSIVFGDSHLERLGREGVDLDALAAEIEASTRLPGRPIDPHRPSLILYTSGTSGRPKGVVLSENALEQTAINFGRLGRVTDRSTFLLDAPMFHIIGMNTCVRAPLLHGGCMLVSDGFDPGRTLTRLVDSQLGVSHYFCVPQMAAALRAHPTFDPTRLRGLTGLFTGGAPQPAETVRAWVRDGVPLVDGFGMSETGTVFGMSVELPVIQAKAGSVGISMPSISTRIVDDGDGDCEPGTPGELLLKGPGLFSGYWRKPDETARAFTADGWFRTGDITVVDADGFFWIVDRKKDMYISGGENVFPAEVEAALQGHPAVADCAVFGVPDSLWGEVGHVAVVVKEGATVSLADVAAYLESRLARYKAPKGLTVLATLPRTASGKIRKDVLRQQCGGDVR